MAVITLTPDKSNPPFTIRDMKMIQPGFKRYLDTAAGIYNFEMFLEMAHEAVFHSMWSSQWKLGMSLFIAHHLVLAAQDASAGSRQGDTLAGVASMGSGGGVLTSWSVGEISKSFDISKTMVGESPDSAYWNLTKFGIRFYSLWRTKQPFNFGVVI